VSYKEPTSKITILNETGKVVRLLDRDCFGNKLFMSPRYIILSLDEESLYVSDAHRDAVVKIHSDGRIGAVFKDEELNRPRGLAIDEHGTVFVAGMYSNNIFQLTSNLTKIGILLGSKDVYGPLSIAIDKHTEKGCLYVGMRKNSKIKTFEIKCIQVTILL
jgi:sugar lactone lactonase YvrE